MANMVRVAELAKLVAQVGSYRKAEAAIKRVKGCAPTFAAIQKAVVEGAGTDYTVQSYINDLIEAINTDNKRH